MIIMSLRPAIAMIELIFAIVVMGIVLMSAPQLMKIAAKSSYVAIQQESIGEAAAQVNMIMGYSWDENDTNESFYSTILTTASNTVVTDLAQVPGTGRRRGTPYESYRSFIRYDGAVLSASSIGADGADLDDIDDFNGTVVHLHNFSTGSVVADYIEKGTDINITTTVAYISDDANYQQNTIVFDPFAAPVGTSNIKSISVTLTSTNGVSELEKEIILKAFSCNIGSYQLVERDF